MDTRERIKTIRLIEKIIKNPEYAKQIGLSFTFDKKAADTNGNYIKGCKSQERRRL